MRLVQFSVVPSGIVLGRYRYIAVTGQLGHRAEVRSVLQSATDKPMSKGMWIGPTRDPGFRRHTLQALEDSAPRKRSALSPKYGQCCLNGVNLQIGAQGLNGAGLHVDLAGLRLAAASFFVNQRGASFQIQIRKPEVDQAADPATRVSQKADQGVVERVIARSRQKALQVRGQDGLRRLFRQKG